MEKMTENEKIGEILVFCKSIYRSAFLYHLITLAAICAAYYCFNIEFGANFNKRLDSIEAKINRIDSLTNLKK
jgi:hypothetical protein